MYYYTTNFLAGVTAREFWKLVFIWRS